MALNLPDWTNIGFSFILITVNLFRHPTLILAQGHFLGFWPNDPCLQLSGQKRSRAGVSTPEHPVFRGGVD